MKRILLSLLCFALLFGAGLLASDNVVASSYGVYGTVTYAGGNPDSVVDGAVVAIYKYVGGQWVYQGSTTASACGYYTYDTGGTGSFKAEVSGSYYLRGLSPCGSRIAYEYVSGFGFGTVSIFNPQVRIDLSTS